jgi:magnesium-transporting ATPase (P-type)
MAADERSGVQWHALEAEEVTAALVVDPRRGLSGSEAARRLEQYGRNRLPEEHRESALVRFVKQFNNVLIYILIVAAAFTAFLGEWIDTGVIVAVVLVNALIGFIQEGKAERALDEIRRMLSLEATVVRDGRRQTVDAEEIVPGDVVLLQSGDRAPADMRILEAREVRVEEAALTGESEPAGKRPEPAAAEALLGDRSSMVYSSTVLTSGQLRGVVVATGEESEIGRIGELVSSVGKMTTPLLEKIGRFGRVLSVFIVAVGALLFVIGWALRGYTVAELLLVVISFAVAAIPEGLPAILTITLALGVQRMGRRNAILRRLPAVETLGSVTTICSDKTGTLTHNELMVGRVLLAQHTVHVGGSGYSAENGFEAEGSFEAEGRSEAEGGFEAVEFPGADGPLRRLARAGALCNDADLERRDGAARISGDPMEAALLVLAEKAGIEFAALRERMPRIDAVPFESAQRFMATLHRCADGERLLIKGAPERVLEMCDGVSTGGGGRTELDEDVWRTRIDEQAAAGYRMLALAEREAPGADRIDSALLDSGGTLLGVVGLMDLPRDEAIAAVAKCRNAGIRVVMVTGDHALTAQSIGARLGIGDGEHALTGRAIEDADDDTLVGLARDHDVIARASPEHKLRLVRALQSVDEVVAMTGDGVNDAPALKQADIGVAMGIKGTEAARSASEMVLADDNFASIEIAVEEGRTVYDNLKKTILFILPTNGAEALMVLTAVALALPELPITPVQILWVNMVTAVTLALALAFEPTEPGTMDRPPRPRNAPILSGHLLARIGYISMIIAAACIALFLLELGAGTDPNRARTIAVNALVTAEAFYLFNCRFVWRSSVGMNSLRGNNAVHAAVGVLLVLQLAFTYLPFMQTWFGTADMRAVDWIWCLVLGAGLFSVVEVEKAVARRRQARPARRIPRSADAEPDI